MLVWVWPDSWQAFGPGFYAQVHLLSQAIALEYLETFHTQSDAFKYQTHLQRGNIAISLVSSIKARFMLTGDGDHYVVRQ